jgi:hypothetical protein
VRLLAPPRVGPAADVERIRLERDWRVWLPTLFPELFSAPFGPHHEQLWRWVWAIQRRQRYPPFVAIWPRGGAKSTSAETAVVVLGALRRRSYALYVCGTQDRADDHVGNIAGRLEADVMAHYYPEMSERAVGKYGNSKGWRRNRLRTAGGFTVDALGLDTASRGLNLEGQRPDLMVFDDIDDQDDSLAIVEKKLGRLRTRILPAGQEDGSTVVLAVQNRIHGDSVFAQLADGRADFLQDRIVSGPVVAVEGLETAQGPDGKWQVQAGQPTWAGQDLATCQAQIGLWGYSAFLTEAQHQDPDTEGGIFNHLTWRRCAWDEVPWRSLIRIVVGCDPAVTDTDESDACGIHADGLSSSGPIYRLWSWEQRTSPEQAMRRAILKAVELGADQILFETDQGGDTWQSVYELACRKLLEDGEIADASRIPPFTSAKAGAGHGSKRHRAQQMLTAYEEGRFFHVEGTHATLEAALRRFPRRKPFDLTDCAYWTWWALTQPLELPAGFGFQATTRGW